MFRPAPHIAVVLLVVASLAASAFASAERAAVPRAAPAPSPPLEPLPVSAKPAAPRTPPTYAIIAVHPGHSVALRSAPGGAVVGTLGDRTDFGSPQELFVAARRGNWLGVTSSTLPNGAVGWVDAHNGSISEHSTDVSLVVGLSRRMLELRIGDRVAARVRVGVGHAGSSTPTGRFAVTDKLRGARYGAYYGCCILALSGHQTSTPAGWQGGDRLAIHGTDDPATIGAAASAGCLHARDRDLMLLMRRAPLGTPVFIHD
jgi:lipoprotein-anchoring transpeptidase ErfK/SrfK